MRNELNKLIERLKKAGLEELNTVETDAGTLSGCGDKGKIDECEKFYALVSFKISNGKIISIYSEKAFEYSDKNIVFYNIGINETYAQITDCWSCKPKDFDETFKKFINETH